MATDEEQRELFKLWQCRNCGRWLSPVACPLHCPVLHRRGHRSARAQSCAYKDEARENETEMKRRLLWLMLQVGVVLTAVGMGVSLSLTNWLAAAGWFIAFCYAYYLLTKP